MAIQKTASEIRQEKSMKQWKHSSINAKKKKAKGKKVGFPNTHNLRGKSYIVFLKSKYWNTVRLAVLKRDNYKCVICKSSGEMHVHHDTYKNHFNEHKHLDDLMTLCKKCHTEHHQAQA